MAGLPDNRSLLSFLSLLNGGNKDSLGDSTYLDSFKPTEYFAGLQGGSPAMQGIYNLGNTVANLANRENNEKTRRIQQNILQNTAMFTNAFQQEIRNLDKDYAADIDASVAELYATTDPAKQELIRKDIIGKQAAYRKAISDKVNLFRGYATQGSPWLLPNKVENVLSGAPSVIEASLGVPQPSVKSIGDTQGKGATTPKWTEADIDMLLDRYSIFPIVQNDALKLLNSGKFLTDMLLYNNVILDDGISQDEARTIKRFMEDDNNFNENNGYTQMLPSILVNNLLETNPELNRIYEELRSSGLGDPFYKKMLGIAKDTITNSMRMGNPILNAERSRWKDVHTAAAKDSKDEYNRQLRDAENNLEMSAVKAFKHDSMLQNQLNLDTTKGFMAAGFDYLQGRTPITKESPFIRTMSSNITPEGVTDNFDNANVFSREIDDALGILFPKYKNKNVLKAIYDNTGSNDNLRLFYDLQLLDRFSSKLSQLSSQQRWDALKDMGDVIEKIRNTKEYPKPGMFSQLFSSIGLPSTIVDPELNQLLYMAAKGYTSNLVQGTKDYFQRRKELETLQNNQDDIITNRAAERYWADRKLVQTSLTSKDKNAQGTQRYSADRDPVQIDLTPEDKEAQGLGMADIADHIANNEKYLEPWVTSVSGEKQETRKYLADMVNMYAGLFMVDPTLEHEDLLKKLEGMKDSIPQEKKAVYEKLLKTLKDPKQYRAFTEVIQDILNSTK